MNAKDEHDAPLTADEIAAIQARLNAATPGPWDYESYHGGRTLNHFSADYTHIGPLEVDRGECREPVAITARPADVEFVLHAPDDVRRLIADNRRKDAEIARLRNDLGGPEYGRLLEQLRTSRNELCYIAPPTDASRPFAADDPPPLIERPLRVGDVVDVWMSEDNITMRRTGIHGPILEMNGSYALIQTPHMKEWFVQVLLTRSEIEADDDAAGA